MLPFFPVSIWKNSGQWALTVCPTADEGQQLMLSHIPAHLPGGAATKYHATSPSDETPWNFSQQQNTTKHLQATKHHATSPKDQGSYGIKDAQHPEKQAGWDRASPAETCWDLDRTEQVLLASNQPQQAPGPSHSGPWLHWSLLARQRATWGIVNFASGPWLPVCLLVTIGWPWKDEGNKMWVF